MKLTKGGKLDRPNLCCLCERTPPIDAPVIDTGRYFDGFPHNLQGRRYVCEICIKSMCKFIDLIPMKQVEEIISERDQALLELKELKAVFSRLSESVGSVRT